MPRYQVIEKRALYNGVIIDAVDEQAAKQYDGTIIAESETDSWGDELHSIEEVEPDREEVELPG